MPLTIFDIADKANPVKVGFIQGGGSPNYLGFPSDVVVSGNYAYIGCSGDDCITVMDITDPTNPVYSNRLTAPGTPNYLAGPQGMKIVGDYLYVLS